MFQSDGVMGPEVGGLLRKSQDLRQADEKKLIRLMDDVLSMIEEKCGYVNSNQFPYNEKEIGRAHV